MEQRQGQEMETSIRKRLYKIVKTEVKTASTAAGITSTFFFGKSGLIIPIIYRVSKKISDFIGGEILCVNNIVSLGIPKSVASVICGIYKKLFFLYLLVQMLSFSYINIFSDTPTVLNFSINYADNIRQLVMNLSKDFAGCSAIAFSEAMTMSMGVGGFLELGFDALQDINNVTFNYIISELTNLAIGFSANIGILTNVNSIGEYIKNLYSISKNIPKDIQNWITGWSESLIDSGMANMVIENKGQVINEFTNAKMISAYNETIVNTLDDSIKSLGTKKFSKIYESKELVESLSDSFKDKSYSDMSWIERAWSIVNIKSPTNSSLPIVHKNIIRATNQTVDTLIDGMKESRSKIVKRIGNTETMNNYCKTKIRNRLDEFDSLFETSTKIYDNAIEINRDYLKFLPQYEINLSKGMVSSLPLQIDPTIDGGNYNPAPDMLVTVNILTLIILILVFVQSIIIPLARVGKSLTKSIYQKVSRRD
jgi:hypothetical protein